MVCCAYFLRLFRFVRDVFRLRSLWRALCPSSSSLLLVVEREDDLRVVEVCWREVEEACDRVRDVVLDDEDL